MNDDERNEDDDVRDLKEDSSKQRDLEDMFESPNPHKQNIHHENNQVVCNTATNTDVNNIPVSATTVPDIENDCDDGMGIDNNIDDDVSLLTTTKNKRSTNDDAELTMQQHRSLQQCSSL